MSFLIAFFTALPELVRLVKTMQRQIEEANTKRKVKEDVKAINEAFKKKDPDSLKRIFDT